MGFLVNFYWYNSDITFAVWFFFLRMITNRFFGEFLSEIFGGRCYFRFGNFYTEISYLRRTMYGED